MNEEISKEDAMNIVRGKTFTYKTKFKVIAILAALVLCPLFLWAIYNVWSNYLLKGGNIYVLAALTIFVFIPMLFLGPVGVIDAFRRKIKISETEFFARGLFKTKIITFDKIKKFRIQEHQYGYELLLLGANESEQLKISSYIGNIDLIFYFCSVYFENLDATELEHERQTILNDPSYGYTVEQKEENIQKVKKIAKIGSILGYGIWGLWIASQLFLKQAVIFNLVVYGILLIPLFY
ncbi:MAG: hypothetical protein M9962_07120, partial [Oligoflexia bacterium]|nr:hypothetical protein [Oligoflexia bacterium]